MCSKLNQLHIYPFFFTLFFGHAHQYMEGIPVSRAAWRVGSILVPRPGIKPTSATLEVLTTEPPAKSPSTLFSVLFPEAFTDYWVEFPVLYRRSFLVMTLAPLGFPCGSAGKESTSNAGDLGSIPGLGRFLREGKRYSLQYSGLENSRDTMVHGVAKSQTQLSNFHFLWLLY